MKKILILLLSIYFGLSGCEENKESHLKQQFPEYSIAISDDSERIAYTATGNGDVALVFIHGWSCDARYWRNQVPVFAQNYRVLTIDLAGHGHSSSTRSDFTISSFANDLKAVIEKEQIGKAILIGHSMGGGVIASAARIMPKRVIGIIGIDTFHSVAEQMPQSVIDNMVKPFEDNFKEAAQNFVSSMFPSDTDDQLIRWVKEDMSSAPKEIALSAFRNYLGQYITGESAGVFKGIDIPVVSINARLWPTDYEKNMKHISNYKLIYIEESGHFPMLEKPEEFNNLLQKAIRIVK
ncbi:MAG: alpha/beta hydrolase [Gammaproteobacteria bacterium]|nr:MAG: alpha/beta hydrolase [Gammaproteobacteria bacterium]